MRPRCLVELHYICVGQMCELSLKARIAELENTNEYLRSQLVEKEKVCLELRKMIKGHRDMEDVALRIPNEKENEIDPVVARMTLMSTDSKFEIEYLKALDDARIKSIALEELRNTLNVERESRMDVLQIMKERCVEKDIQIENLQNALESSCKRSCTLEDQLAKAKQRSAIHVANSPVTTGMTPRVSVGSTYSDLQQRHSFSGQLPSITPNRAPLHLSTNILPQYSTIPSHAPNAFFNAQYANR